MNYNKKLNKILFIIILLCLVYFLNIFKHIQTYSKYVTENNEKIHIRTNFNNGQDKECISSIYVENPDGSKYTPLFSKHYPKEIQELLNKENVTGAVDKVDKMNEIIMKYYDKYTTNLMK